ncbi:MAG TPA: hypothetical protein VG963_31120, partial [Polyangiaceae bacterium]|nr:hypothetical protein [Polyangiaceae bacterium]
MSKRTFSWVMGLGLCALGAAGCSGAKAGEVADDGFLNGVPEEGALQMSLTDDTSAEGLATDDDQVAAAYVSDELGSMTEHLDAPASFGIARPRQAVKDLNEALRDFLQPIAALVRAQAPTDIQGNLATWGPVTRGATEYRLYVRKGLVQRFGWLLQARPEGSTDDFDNVAAGAIRVGTVARRGHGVVGVDLDALSSADPSVTAGGKILAAFAHEPGATVLAYALRDFTPNSADQAALDALFQGLHLGNGDNRVRLAFRTNLPDTASAAEELVLARVREHAGQGGRADLLATGGDIADGRVWVVSECWDHALASTYRRVLDCPGDG